jgi:hypothetical protein
MSWGLGLSSGGRYGIENALSVFATLHTLMDAHRAMCRAKGPSQASPWNARVLCEGLSSGDFFLLRCAQLDECAEET